MAMTAMRRVTVGLLMVAVLAAGQTASAQGARVSRVATFQADSWSVWVSAGWHRVVVDGDGDTDLDLYVTDTAGNRLAVDDDETDYCVGRFYMRSAGYIQIRIRNLGDVYNEYQISVQ